MKFLVVLACLIATAFAARYSTDEWEEWKEKYGKQYNSNGDESYRRFVFGENQAFVDKHNYEYSQGKHSYRVGMNQFADLNTHEFVKMYLRPFQRQTGTCSNSTAAIFEQNGYVTIPKHIDWREKGYVTPVKNQAQCGSCWAFSTTGSIEGQHFKATGNLVSLSEQNLMDCSKPEGDFSCEGGLMDYAFDYVIENKGIDTEASYPYEARDENKCKYSKANIGATITGCVDVSPSGDESSLHKAVGNVGPISVAIDASHQSFQLYKSGVYNEPQCSSLSLDHGVLAVGYGSTESGVDYWIVKNSWGAEWGMKGYLKMSRNNNNNCGIATSASYPVA